MVHICSNIVSHHGECNVPMTGGAAEFYLLLQDYCRPACSNSLVLSTNYKRFSLLLLLSSFPGVDVTEVATQTPEGGRAGEN